MHKIKIGIMKKYYIWRIIVWNRKSRKASNLEAIMGCVWKVNHYHDKYFKLLYNELGIES